MLRAVPCALQEKDPRAYQFCLQLPDGSSFLGSSPEQLYSRTADSVASEAVAATRPRGPLGKSCDMVIWDDPPQSRHCSAVISGTIMACAIVEPARALYLCINEIAP